MIELHGESSAALRHGAQVAYITEHVGKRHHGIDDVGIAAHVLALDLPAPRIEVTDDRAGILLRRDHLYLHDRLEKDRTAIAQRLAQSCARADFKGKRR